MFSGEQADYWHRIHASLVAKGSPLSGVVRGPAKGRDHIVLFWLRLPLSDDGGRVDRILCYDVAAPVRERGQPSPSRTLFCYSRIPPRPLARRVQFG